MTDECADQERDLGNVYPPCHQRGGSVWIRYHPEAARFFPEVMESTFYAILRRLHKEGAATTFAGEVSKGPVRKYYKITEQGQQQLEQLKADWRCLQETVSKIGI